MNINNHAFAIVKFANELRTAESPAPDPSDLTPQPSFPTPHAASELLTASLFSLFRGFWCNECFHSFLNASQNGSEELLFCRQLKAHILILGAVFINSFFPWSLKMHRTMDPPPSSEKSHLVNERNAKYTP